VFSDPKTGVLYVYYGQERYTTLLNALQYLPTDPFTEGDTFDFTTFLGYLVLRGNASDITDTNNNSIINGGLFRGSGQGSGGGVAISNLDDLTDVSITGPTNGEALVYNSGIWQNGIPVSASFASSGNGFFTGSFTGSFKGDGSQLTGIVSSKWTGSNPISRESDVEITGSLNVTNGITGSLFGTSSYALQALSSSFALTASYLDNYIPPFPFIGNAIITGSLTVTGAITASYFRGDGIEISGISAINWFLT
jgi:hypothetical protein